MAHTKAPWIVRPFDLDDITNPVREVETSGETWQYQDWAIIDPVTQRTVATVGWRADLGAWGPTRDREEAIANRALVLTAPDLLAVLEEFVEDVETSYQHSDEYPDGDALEMLRVEWPDLEITYEKAVKAIALAKGGK